LRTISQVEDDTSANSGPDGTSEMYYAAHGAGGSAAGLDTLAYPFMDSLAHLGRLPYSRSSPWTTLPLVGEDAVDVARYFSVRPELPPERGRININSPFPVRFFFGRITAPRVWAAVPFL